MPRLRHPELAQTIVLGVRLTADESARLDALVARVPIASRHRVGRVALLRGLDAIERNPSILVEPARPRRGEPKPRRR